MTPRPPPTPRAKAVAWLAQRDHSELELRRKLARWLASEAAKAARATEAGRPIGDIPARAEARIDDIPCGAAARIDDSACDAEARIDDTLAWLKAKGYLDDARFVQQRVSARQGRLGAARIRQELAQHGLALPPDEAAALRETEFERARALWQRRYGAPPDDARGAARQVRFLIGRGFSAEVVRRVLRQAGAADDEAA